MTEMLTVNLSFSPGNGKKSSGAAPALSCGTRVVPNAGPVGFPLQRRTAYTWCQMPEVYSHVWSFRGKTLGKSRAAQATGLPALMGIVPHVCFHFCSPKGLNN